MWSFLFAFCIFNQKKMILLVFLMSKMLLMVEHVSHQSELIHQNINGVLSAFFECCFFFFFFVYIEKKDFENTLSVLISNFFCFCFFFSLLLHFEMIKTGSLVRQIILILLCTNWDEYTQNSRLILIAMITKWCLVFFFLQVILLVLNELMNVLQCQDDLSHWCTIEFCFF